MNKSFIKLHTVTREYNGSTFAWVKGSDVIIRIDSVLQIGMLSEDKVWDSKECWKRDRYDTEKSQYYRKSFISTITTSAIHGMGINGIYSDLTIDEESFLKLIKALDIENL